MRAPPVICKLYGRKAGKTRTWAPRNGSYVSRGSPDKLGIACASPADSGWLFIERCVKGGRQREGGSEEGHFVVKQGDSWINWEIQRGWGQGPRLRWLQGLIRREFKRKHTLLCKSTEPPRPPPLNNVHIAATLMLKPPLVWLVPLSISAGCGRISPKAGDFCNYKESNGAQVSFLLGFGGEEG